MPPAAAQAYRLEPLEVLVNGSKAGNWVLLNDGGRFYAPQDALEAWRVQRLPRRTIEHRRIVWFALEDIPGFSGVLDPEALTIDLKFSPTVFGATVLGQEATPRRGTSDIVPSVFAGYDLSATAFALDGDATGARSRIESSLGGLGEVGLSHGWGVWSSSFLFRATSGTGADAQGLQRLETGFTRDFPDERLTLRVGDGVTRGSATGRAIYFGGVQLGRNFRLAPGYITQPVPSLAGSAATPSTVQLYINNVLRQTSTVPAGPFAIQNPPLISGTGDVRLVVRDALGRETVVTQSFTSSPELLEEGLSDWSVEAGYAREGIGTPSSTYSKPFTTGVYRHGLSKRLTVEGRTVASGDVRALGAALNFPGPWRSLLQTAAAASHSARGWGHRLELDVDQQVGRHSVNVALQAASVNYAGLGIGETFRLRSSRTAAYSYSSDTLGSLGLSTVSTIDARGSLQRADSLTYGVSLGALGTLSLNLSRLISPTQPQPVMLLFATLSLPLQPRQQAALQYSRFDRGRAQVQASYQKLNPEPGQWSWRGSLADREGGPVAEFGASRELSQTVLNADLSAAPGRYGTRLGLTGGAVWVDGSLYATRNSRDSMAIIEVADLEGVTVRSGNSLPVRTAGNGRAVLTGLQAYLPNPVSIDADALPLTAEVESLEMQVVPPYRSAVRARFPIRLGRAALLRVQLDDGATAPPGAVVRVVGDDREFSVARRGEVYLSAIKDRSELELRWRDQRCRMTLSLPPGQRDEIARVGPLTCSGVQR